MSVYLQDYVILDEGHKIKNPTKTSKGVHMIAARHRIILTGTPIQNNLKVYILITTLYYVGCHNPVEE